MKVRLVRSYKSKNGNVVFVYAVTGTPEQLEQFRAAQGDNFREDDNGNALWFTTRCIGNTGSLIITTKGNIVPDMSAFDQANSLAKQYGGNFGQELARMAAEQLMGGNKSVATQAVTKTVIEPVTTTSTGLED
jgi:hypothetical protein